MGNRNTEDSKKTLRGKERERECRRKMICEKEGRLRASGVRDKRLRE